MNTRCGYFGFSYIYRVRLAIISDIHEDYPSLKECHSKIRKLGYDRLICLGDISGFSEQYYSYPESRNARGCLQLVREACDLVIPGNHDLHATGRIPSHSRIFDFPEQWYEIGFAERENISEGSIWLHEDDMNPGYDEEELKYLTGRPEFEVLDCDGYSILLSHYIFPNLSGFLKKFYDRAPEFTDHFAFMKERECILGITGHTHSAGGYLVYKNRIRYHNRRNTVPPELPAIIGVPAITRQGTTQRFTIFDTESLVIRHLH